MAYSFFIRIRQAGCERCLEINGISLVDAKCTSLSAFMRTSTAEFAFLLPLHCMYDSQVPMLCHIIKTHLSQRRNAVLSSSLAPSFMGLELLLFRTPP